jgi:hypothetical protein
MDDVRHKLIVNMMDEIRICVACNQGYRVKDNLTQLDCLVHNMQKQNFMHPCCQLDRNGPRDNKGRIRTRSDYPEKGCTRCIHTCDPKVRARLEALDFVMPIDKSLVDSGVVEIDKTRLVPVEDPDTYYLKAFGKVGELSYWERDRPLMFFN